jgi:hypothetical protein
MVKIFCINLSQLCAIFQLEVAFCLLFQYTISNLKLWRAQMGNMIKGFVLMMGQILKKLIIIVVIATLCYAAYLAWGKFIKKTQKNTRSAAVSRAEQQGIKVDK